LFRNFEVKGNGDRVLIYLTVFISECLGKIAAKSPAPNQQDAMKLLNTLAVGAFTLPGDPNFPLNAIFQKPSGPQEIGGSHFSVKGGVFADTRFLRNPPILLEAIARRNSEPVMCPHLRH
jgi:hypothetical protein